MELKAFVKHVPDFNKSASSYLIEYFAYYLLYEKRIEGFKAKDIQACFDELHLSAYSNIPSYLSRSSKRGKSQKYLKRKDLYFLESSTKELIEQKLKKEFEPEPSDNLFPLSIFNDTRGYLISFANEASCSYDYSLYNSCFFMLRKILETLIIELFERHGIEDKIKNGSGGYLFLSDLITKLVGENKWHLTKIVREDIPKIKKLADSSVHSKRFSAKKTDIDNMKTEIRIILQELVNHIDYPNWKSN
jgi:hypothetical protein